MIGIQHFSHALTNKSFYKRFYIIPSEISNNANRAELPYSLGATLYTPATNQTIADKLLSSSIENLSSNVICLEDAVSDDSVAFAEKNLYTQIDRLARVVQKREMKKFLPMLFVRVRSPEQLQRILVNIPQMAFCISGFVFPKIDVSNAKTYFDILAAERKRTGSFYYAMPILEIPEIINIESRVQTLTSIKAIFDIYHEMVLNVRVGGTDFSGMFGIRHPMCSTVYDMLVVSDCLKDILNVFSRAKDSYVVSGPVYEYFTTSLNGNATKWLTIESNIDKTNGFVGKTIIHPTQILPVELSYAVRYEDYVDAKQIVDSNENGVIASRSKNKMNEVKPHMNWACKTLKLAKIYGVLREDV